MAELKIVSRKGTAEPSEKAVEEQLTRFREGFPYLRITAPAGVGNGIERLPQERVESLGKYYDSLSGDLKIVKFVPASGAATRMFKDLFGYLDTGKTNDAADTVYERLEDFAFGAEAAAIAGREATHESVVRAILSPSGLGYGSMPKGLILFHKYPAEVRTALEEHLVEGAQYAAGNGRVNLHFTVSPEHVDDFAALLEKVMPVYESRFGVTYHVELSVQDGTTDTIAVNPDNTPFTDASGKPVFRPAGHGALLSNLAGIDADLVFIKNIDNVTTDSRRSATVLYKKALAGLLLELRSEVFSYLDRMSDNGASQAELDAAAGFVSDKLHIGLPSGFDGWPAQRRRECLVGLLDRPVRVCGMVRNQGEPGGGPFFARNADGTVSLQIAELAQIAPGDRHMLSEATHFNPVDLVCSFTDREGRVRDLQRYVDPQTGLISEKSKDGRPLRALELPGLWNGSMSGWITVFVEVPLETFTPVKTVTDLLRPEHMEKR